MSRNIYSTAHLVPKQAMDEVDLIPGLAWFGGDPEIKVANSCIQLLFKCQILGIQTHYILDYRLHKYWLGYKTTHLLHCKHEQTFKMCPK